MSLILRLRRLAAGVHPVALAWTGTAALVAAAFALRLALNPVFAASQTYSLFYPVVLLSAYLFGRAPAFAAIVASAMLGFYVFANPALSWKASPATLTSVAMFAMNASVGVILITALTGAVREFARAQSRAEVVARNHAALFRELSERISHQLRVVAGVLTLQAKGEPEPDVMRGLQRASERSVLMARVHRELAGHADDPVDFDAFVRGLVAAVCEAQGAPPEQVRIQPSGIWLPPEQATSLGVALAECVTALLCRKDAGALTIRLEGGGVATRLLVARTDAVSGAELSSLSSGYLLRAMVEQLGAAIALRTDGEGSALEISIPHARPAVAERQSAGMLH